MNTNNINMYNSSYSYTSPNFTATAKQYKSAVRYLKSEKRQGCRSIIKNKINWIKNGIKHHYPLKWITNRLSFNPKYYSFDKSSKGHDLEHYGIKALDIDKLDGIQYGIDIFKDLSMREIMFLAYRTMNVAVTRGCANMCAHCFQNAVPADKKLLSSMPYEDFQKISNGFSVINKRVNKILKNRNTFSLIGKDSNDFTTKFSAELTGFFYDSDGIAVAAKDSMGKIHDFVDLTEDFCSATGKRVVFDSVGWNPKNKMLQERAEKYAKYFAQPGIEQKVEQVNLSVNPFNPLYRKAYELGYRAGVENDLTNPNIQQGKVLYDRYIDRVANMIATLGASENASLLMTYSTRYEQNMSGMYLSDLKLILSDAQKKCDTILKEKYPNEEYLQKSKKINKMINQSISREENRDCHSRCIYSGRYKELYSQRNPNYKESNGRYTPVSKDINTMTPKEFEDFFNSHMALVDTNGQIYYMNYDTSLRSMNKELKLSTNGKETPKIFNIESREL